MEDSYEQKMNGEALEKAEYTNDMFYCGKDCICHEEEHEIPADRKSVV